MFYSTLEPLDLPCSGPMETQGVPKFHEPSPTPEPVLYVGPVSDALAHVPLKPLFLRGSPTPSVTDRPALFPKPAAR